MRVLEQRAVQLSLAQIVLCTVRQIRKQRVEPIICHIGHKRMRSAVENIMTAETQQIGGGFGRVFLGTLRCQRGKKTGDALLVNTVRHAGNAVFQKRLVVEKNVRPLGAPVERAGCGSGSGSQIRLRLCERSGGKSLVRNKRWHACNTSKSNILEQIISYCAGNVRILSLL